MRPASSKLREITFTVEAKEGLSAIDLGDMLGVGAEDTTEYLMGAASSATTRRMIDYLNREYDSVLFTQAQDVWERLASGHVERRVQLSCLQVA